VLTNVPTTDPAVNRPELLMLPPPPVTDHVGEIATALPFASFPTPVNSRVPFTATVAESGLTVMVANLDIGSPGVTDVNVGSLGMTEQPVAQATMRVSTIKRTAMNGHL
jgi:hypothetical protein